MDLQKQEAERPKQLNEQPEFIKAKGCNNGIHMVIKEMYQPVGFITKFNKDGSARKKLAQGRWIKRCIWVPLSKDYRKKPDEINTIDTTVV